MVNRVNILSKNIVETLKIVTSHDSKSSHEEKIWNEKKKSSSFYFLFALVYEQCRIAVGNGFSFCSALFYK